MSQKKKLTTEERERRRVAREEKALLAKEAAVRRQRALRKEKKLNLYDYMSELTGCPDLSIAQLKDLLNCEYTVKNGENERSLRICDLITDAARTVQERNSDG